LVADNTQARTSPEGKQFSVHPVREEGVLRDCKRTVQIKYVTARKKTTK